MKNIFLSLYLFFSGFWLFADNYATQKSLDVLHYEFQIEIFEEHDSIKGVATIQFKVLEETPTVFFDFDQSMVVDWVKLEGNKIEPSIQNNQITLKTKNPFKPGIYVAKINYKGIPKDGLIISKNKYENRTFFGDNWPNRAQYWFPCVDHPSDKATVDFKIIAPAKYQVVANGVLKEKSNTNNGKFLTHYTSNQVLPTKVMVFGAAEFAVDYITSINGNLLESWVYPENKKEGFYDYALAANVLDFFEDKLGDYPYDRLANVQSKTRYGGMENAGCIFYFEGSVTGFRDSEELIAHEIAHQWFGNSASEKSWEHIWLSEGFATYLTGLYLLENKDFNAFESYMDKTKQKVFSFNEKFPKASIIPAEINDLNSLLNPLSYQKAAWVLHMASNQFQNGDGWTLFKNYHEKFKYGNATTSDFFELVSENPEISKEQFINQWLKSSTIPEVEVSYKINTSKNEVTFNLKQVHKSKEVFILPIEISWLYPNSMGKTIKTVWLNQKSQSVTFTIEQTIGNLEFDPLGKLLVKFSAKD